MLWRRVIFGLLVLVALVAIIVFVRPGDVSAPRSLVVATIHPIAEMVRAVAGDRFTVETLLPPGASPHTFEPTTRQVQTLAHARVLFRVGLGLELWADGMIDAAANSTLRVVTVSDGMELMRFDQSEEEGGHAEHEPGEGDAGGHEAGSHHHGEYNPHVWLDPLRAALIVEKVRDALAAIDPDGREAYALNAERYRQELVELDRAYRDGTGAMTNRRFVVFHNAYAYLAARYDLQIVGVIEEAPGKEPGARHIRDLIDRLRELKAAAILIEPQFSPKIAQAIARDAGVRVVTVDPLGDPDDPERATYLSLMRHNLAQLAGTGGGR